MTKGIKSWWGGMGEDTNSRKRGLSMIKVVNSQERGILK